MARHMTKTLYYTQNGKLVEWVAAGEDVTGEGVQVDEPNIRTTRYLPRICEKKLDLEE